MNDGEWTGKIGMGTRKKLVLRVGNQTKSIFVVVNYTYACSGRKQFRQSPEEGCRKARPGAWSDTLYTHSPVSPCPEAGLGGL